MRGTNKGTCAGDNWFDRPESGCTATCVHSMLLAFAPYYALWYPGPLAKEWRQGEANPNPNPHPNPDPHPNPNPNPNPNQP